VYCVLCIVYCVLCSNHRLYRPSFYTVRFVSFERTGSVWGGSDVLSSSCLVKGKGKEEQTSKSQRGGGEV
jgi:hypothetical protein